MKYIEKISKLFNIDEIYIGLILKTIIIIFLILVVEKIGIRIIKRTRDSKKEYNYTKKYKLIIRITILSAIIIVWGKYIKNFLTLISLVSAAFTIAIRDLIFNFFCGIYIKIVKPFVVEDRIEINGYKGDVVNINTMNFEILEVSNVDTTGQSTGIIIHLPNSIIFNYPLKNYNKAFKYIWDEITIRIPLDYDVNKAKKVLYKIVNSNEIIKKIPPKLKKQINNVSNSYRIYYNQYDPIIYTKINEDHIELQIRYLIHPKKARYVESIISSDILLAYKNGEIEIYK
ncbi:MAG: mechanosensitive ion channel family protein [Candidatus Gastranaerophilaceae bacterium]|nr:mechanosensitive ion channel family protein [Bacilli bacterium]HJJ19982.1 mechanosensitive ion channel family protein [Bacilli bacterium]